MHLKNAESSDRRGVMLMPDWLVMSAANTLMIRGVIGALADTTHSLKPTEPHKQNQRIS